jgi:hypothetical protein
MNTKYICHIYPPSLFPYVLPFLPGSHPQTGLVSPSCLSFLKKKLLVYDSYTGGLVVTFLHMHIPYPNLVHHLHYSSSYPIPLFRVASTGYNSIWYPLSNFSSRYISAMNIQIAAYQLL